MFNIGKYNEVNPPPQNMLGDPRSESPRRNHPPGLIYKPTDRGPTCRDVFVCMNISCPVVIRFFTLP